MRELGEPCKGLLNDESQLAGPGSATFEFRLEPEATQIVQSWIKPTRF